MKHILILFLFSTQLLASEGTKVEVQYHPEVKDSTSWSSSYGYAVTHDNFPEIDIVISKKKLAAPCKMDMVDRTNESVFIRVPRALGVHRNKFPQITHFSGGDSPFAHWSSWSLDPKGTVTITHLSETHVEGILDYDLGGPRVPVSANGKFSLPLCRWEEMAE